jgi:hypothetical protein
MRGRRDSSDAVADFGKGVNPGNNVDSQRWNIHNRCRAGLRVIVAV